MESTPEAPDKRRTRLFVWTFLAMFAFCGVFGVEAWPFTGWRLFADARERHTVSWNFDAYATAGERLADVRLPLGTLDARKFEAASPAEQEATCRQWLANARLKNAKAAEIRLVRIERDLAQRNGSRGVAPTETVAYGCTEAGVRRA